MCLKLLAAALSLRKKKLRYWLLLVMECWGNYPLPLRLGRQLFPHLPIFYIFYITEDHHTFYDWV